MERRGPESKGPLRTGEYRTGTHSNLQSGGLTQSPT